MTDNDNWHLGSDGEIFRSPLSGREFKVKRGSASSYLAAQFLEQLEAILAAYSRLKSSSRYDDLSDVSSTDIHTLLTRSRAALERISGAKSVYSHHIKAVLSHGNWESQKLIAA